MFALPTVSLQNGNTKLYAGTLFKLPPELSTHSQLKHYVEISKLGWSYCPQGYHVYAFEGAVTTKFIIPGLTISGEKNSSKNFYGSSRHSFQKSQIEAFAKDLLERDLQIQKAKNDEIALLVHDLRAFSSAIYNSALSAKSAAATASIFVQNPIETVLATHTMLSIRIDMIDAATDSLPIDSTELIPVYKKIDKVVRCFRPKAEARNISISLTSTNGSFAFTFGPPLFELIAYSVIDNAVKYSPDGGKIFVNVEDYENEVVVKVRSRGPKIREDERSKIFKKGVRGDSAQKSGRDGTGVGLSTAAELVDNYFDGSITVHQSSTSTLQGDVQYFETEFEILVPRHA